MKKIYHSCLFVSGLFFFSCNAQPTGQHPVHTPASQKPVGGGCDGCELMYAGMPAAISSSDTSAGWKEQGQKILVTGKVFNTDGKTPAPNVVVYYWQTDNNGYYSPSKGMTERAKRHGHIRGWVKSDSGGRYAIYTIRPAPYPNESIPAHIHIAIKEPGIANEYYIDEFVFDDDPLLTVSERKKMENRGGNGILKLLQKDTIQVAEHDIILGLNIPNYPSKKDNKDSLQSGLSVGEKQPSFIPFHVYGPDKGTRACPVCKYGSYQGIIYFAGTKADWNEIKQWLKYLDAESIRRGKYLKVYFVYATSNDHKIKTSTVLEKMGLELDLQKIAVTYVPSFDDAESEVNLSRINSAAESTFIIYRQGTIVDKYINLLPSEQNYKRITMALDNTKGNYADLGETINRNN